MIINYPTGLYKSILPSKLEIAGNITYTASNPETPTKKDIYQTQIPDGVKSIRINRKPINRGIYGGLVLTQDYTKNSILNNNSLKYEIGQVIEFTQDTISIIPTDNKNKLEISHNTNELDLTEYDSAKAILDSAYEAQTILRDRLSDSRSKYNNLLIEIDNIKKNINETNKLLDALNIADTLLNRSDLKPTINQAKNKLDALQAEYAIKLSDLDKISAESNKLINDLRIIGVIVK